MDGTGGRASVGNGLDDRLRASKKVPADKQIRDGGLQGLRIGIRGPPFGKDQFLQVRIILQKGQIGKLADGDDGQIRFINLLRTGYGNRPGPSPGIRLFQLIADEFHGLEAAVLRNNPGRGNQKLQFDPLGLGGIHFLMMGGHLFPGPPIEHGHLFRPHPQAGPGRIHPRIPVPDDDYFFPEVQRFSPLEVRINRSRAWTTPGRSSPSKPSREDFQVPRAMKMAWNPSSRKGGQGDVLAVKTDSV